MTIEIPVIMPENGASQSSSVDAARLAKIMSSAVQLRDFQPSVQALAASVVLPKFDVTSYVPRLDYSQLVPALNMAALLPKPDLAALMPKLKCRCPRAKYRDASNPALPESDHVDDGLVHRVIR